MIRVKFRYVVLQLPEQKQNHAVAVVKNGVMKIKFFILVFSISSISILSKCTNSSLGENVSGNNNSDTESLIVYINTAQFKEKVFDFDSNNEWKYNGTKPCIVDFYADWCGPCKKLLPVLKDLAEEYKDKIVIYKVNIDNERRLAEVFGISSIPALLFCPMEGKPTMSNGYLDKAKMKEMINSTLFIK